MTLDCGPRDTALAGSAEGRGGGGGPVPRGHLCFWPFYFKKGFHEHQEVKSFPPSKAYPTKLQGEKHLTPQGGDQPCFVFAVAWLGAQLNSKPVAG